MRGESIVFLAASFDDADSVFRNTSDHDSLRIDRRSGYLTEYFAQSSTDVPVYVGACWARFRFVACYDTQQRTSPLHALWVYLLKVWLYSVEDDEQLSVPLKI